MIGSQRRGHGVSEEEDTDMISGVSKVVIEVEDQDGAKMLWTETMGFGLAQDAPYEEERWLEVRSPERATNLVLKLRTGEPAERRVTPDHLPTSNVMFRCDDLTATYEELSARGVGFPQPPVRQPFGSWSMFDDAEGNRFALEQTESDAP
jgi:predicted enzyme related to lactoylglutathione lyase